MNPPTSRLAEEGRRGSTATPLPLSDGRGVDQSSCSSSSLETDGELKWRPTGDPPGGREGPDPGEETKGAAIGYKDLELEGRERRPAAPEFLPSGLGSACLKRTWHHLCHFE